MTAIATKHKGRTNTYQFSIPNNDEGRQALADYRHIAKVHNADERLKALKDENYKPLIWKVEVQARLGKNNPNAQKYRDRNASASWRNPYQRIARADGATLDVYAAIFTKVTNVYSYGTYTHLAYVKTPPAAILA